MLYPEDPTITLPLFPNPPPAIGQDLLDSMRSKISDDRDFGPIVSRLQEQDDPQSTYRLENGLLFLKDGERMCIPHDPETKTVLLQEVHDSALAGHPGLDKTYTRLSKIAHWPNIPTCANTSRNTSNPATPAESPRIKQASLTASYSRSRSPIVPGHTSPWI